MVQRHWKIVLVVAAFALACGGTTDGGSTDGGGHAGDAGGGDGGAADAGCGCPGVCLRDGGCGECELDSHCPAARPACDLARNVCVVCRESPDSCGQGQYCLNEACVPGCGDASDCASGVCLPMHDCLNCQRDAECADGRLCGTGTCAPACNPLGCAVGWTCCGTRCVDLTRDPLHCGLCTRVCQAGSFCGRGACHVAQLWNVCEAPVATSVLDGYDDWSGLQLAGALEATCSPMVTSRSAGQADAGVLAPDTGEPLVLGELLCVAGGTFHQHAARWMESSGAAPVIDNSTAAIYRYSLRDGGVLVQGPSSAITATHDVFVIQIATSRSGAPVVNVSGFYSQGTAAGAWYFINALLPGRATLTSSWKVVDWVDANFNGSPDAQDTWTVIASGP